MMIIFWIIYFYDWNKPATIASIIEGENNLEINNDHVFNSYASDDKSEKHDLKKRL